MKHEARTHNASPLVPEPGESFGWQRLRCVLIMCLFSVSVASCSESDPRIAAARKDFSRIHGLAAAASKADRIVLYEGLPHQMFERQSLHEELRNKQTIRIGEYPFYAEQRTLSATEIVKLRALLSDKRRYRCIEPGVAKGCGGFHPDWCLEIHTGSTVNSWLLCFGCHEVKVFGPTPELYCDLGTDDLKAILDVHRTNRPPQRRAVPPPATTKL